MISHILAIIFISLVISGILFYGEDEELKVESLFSLPREMSEHSTYYVCFLFGSTDSETVRLPYEVSQILLVLQKEKHYLKTSHVSCYLVW